MAKDFHGDGHFCFGRLQYPLSIYHVSDVLQLPSVLSSASLPLLVAYVSECNSMSRPFQLPASKDYWDDNCEVPDWQGLRIAAWELQRGTRDIRYCECR